MYVHREENGSDAAGYIIHVTYRTGTGTYRYRYRSVQYGIPYVHVLCTVNSRYCIRDWEVRLLVPFDWWIASVGQLLRAIVDCRQSKIGSKHFVGKGSKEGSLSAVDDQILLVYKGYTIIVVSLLLFLISSLPLAAS